MTAKAEPTTTITARVPRKVRQDLEALARATGRNRNTLVHDALTRFIETQRWQIAMVEDRLRQADAGDFASDGEMEELWAELGLDADDAGEPATRAAR